MSDCIDYCPFCETEEKEFRDRIIFQNKKFFLIYSKYEVCEGHLLIIPKEHYPDVSFMPSGDWKQFGKILRYAIKWTENYEPDGLNIGWNVGAAGGQTIAHAHCHVIPRNFGDVEDPTGGIRNVIPEKGKYTTQ